MPAILRSGEHRYRVVENFAKLPDGWTLTDVASVGVDSKDRIYVFNRGAAPDGGARPRGKLLAELWRRAVLRAHGLHIDSDDNLFIAPTTATTPCANAPPTARCC